jgi:hypothetical protein
VLAGEVNRQYWSKSPVLITARRVRIAPAPPRPRRGPQRSRAHHDALAVGGKIRACPACTAGGSGRRRTRGCRRRSSRRIPRGGRARGAFPQARLFRGLMCSARRRSAGSVPARCATSVAARLCVCGHPVYFPGRRRCHTDTVLRSPRCVHCAVSGRCLTRHRHQGEGLDASRKRSIPWPTPGGWR